RPSRVNARSDTSSSPSLTNLTAADAARLVPPAAPLAGAAAAAGVAADADSGLDGVTAPVNVTWIPGDFGLSNTFPSTTMNVDSSSRCLPGDIDGRCALQA